MTNAGSRRRRGLSARMKLTLSYAASFGLSGVLIVAAAWGVILLRDFLPELDLLLHAVIPWQVRSFLSNSLAPVSVVVIILLVGIGFLWGWFMSGRMLAPLARIGEVARLVAQGDLSHRVALKGRADEFHDLADAFDMMLDRVEANMAEQQRFAANASHELRTPLAIMRTQLDVARADPERDVDALIDKLDQANTRAIELTEALLVMARADGQSFERKRVDLSLLAEEALETLLPLIERRGIAVEVDSEPGFVVGSPALLLQLITNLLHNAIVHNAVASGVAGDGAAAAGPVRGEIGLRVSSSATSTQLTIANTGAELSETVVSTLAEPFQRGAGRVRRTETGPIDSGDQRGLGLGLAIVQSIVRAHDGTLHLQPLRGGGLIVQATLPRAA